eukprot:CAMPEP_0196577750 /NCGR_PEP_ID=MMETSP1081-20130531/6760_1 /TAXON_ID=36882 /ORGANISM="Pyramimonas amylifera, Strain CCMP720" /LENGTH=365 /DNA_ID=CAMNT_0041896757 /DNA_START=485 /DNA_END=1582 /DNA_ORIENTATION=-
MVSAAFDSALDFSPPDKFETSVLKVVSISEQDTYSSQNGSVFMPLRRDGSACSIGCRSYMEDRHTSQSDISEQFQEHGLPYDDSEPGSFFAVFDGHGGEWAADFVSANLLGSILQRACFTQSVHTAMLEGFLETDAEFEAATRGKEAERDSGTTALALLLLGRHLHVANTGDCRAVLCRRGSALPLSTDQKPSTRSEMTRIELAGGFVDNEGMVNGELSVSRALGDYFLKTCEPFLDQSGPLTAEPEVSMYELELEDEFMILGSDGLWDVFSNQSAVDFARNSLREHNDPQCCSQELVKETMLRTKTYNLSSDNVSVVTVCFHNERPPSREFQADDLPSENGTVKRTVSRVGLSVLRDAIDSLEI